MENMENIFGIVKVGERGQIVIPKQARELFEIKTGDSLLVIGHKDKGIALIKTTLIRNLAAKILESLSKFENNDNKYGQNK